jgi:hypothetical protein
MRTVIMLLAVSLLERVSQFAGTDYWAKTSRLQLHTYPSSIEEMLANTGSGR